MNSHATPFLKWVGGKRWLSTNFQFPILPSFQRYFEPFLGGGAIFFSVKPQVAILSDINQELINAYIQIKINVDQIIDQLLKHQNLHCKEHYYSIRNLICRDELESAVRFIYLNRTCWNGLYRVNRNGKFNVPIGTKKSVSFENGQLEAAAEALIFAEIRCSDFEDSIDMTDQGDFLFVDPPYTANHNFNGFLKYNESMFSWADQRRLQASVARAIGRGVQVAVTNADHESVRDLYKDIASYQQVWRASILAGKASTRRRTSEALFIANFEPCPKVFTS